MKTGISRKLNPVWCRIMMINHACFWGSVLGILGHELFDLGDQLWDTEGLGHHIVLQE
jgi:hypothetical protein